MTDLTCIILINALKAQIEEKYKKMKRNMERLLNVEGGINYSNIKQLFRHITLLLSLLR